MAYCKTKSGNIFKIWSDNEDEETMHVYPADEQYYADSTNCEIIPYSEISATDSNIFVLDPNYQF